MSPLAHKLLWVALSLALAMGIAIDLYPMPEEGSRVHRIPSRGLGYTSFNIPLRGEEISFYRKAMVVKRCYLMGSRRFLLIAIDGAGNRHAVHDPMYCFRGAGWRIRGAEPIPIEGGSAVLLHLKSSSSSRDVAYWFSDSQTRHASVVRYWLQATMKRISMGRSGREPILIMLQSIDGNPINLVEIMNQFGPLFEV
jgi:hypothetical protein